MKIQLTAGKILCISGSTWQQSNIYYSRNLLGVVVTVSHKYEKVYIHKVAVSVLNGYTVVCPRQRERKELSVSFFFQIEIIKSFAITFLLRSRAPYLKLKIPAI